MHNMSAKVRPEIKRQRAVSRMAQDAHKTCMSNVKTFEHLEKF